MYTTDMDTEIAGWSRRASNCRPFIVLCSSLLFNFPPFAAADDGRRRRIDTAAGIDAATTLKKGPVTVVVRELVRWNQRRRIKGTGSLATRWVYSTRQQPASVAVITFAVFQLRRRVSRFFLVRWSDKSVDPRRSSDRAGCAFDKRFLDGGCERWFRPPSCRYTGHRATHRAVCLTVCHCRWECLLWDELYFTHSTSKDNWKIAVT